MARSIDASDTQLIHQGKSVTGVASDLPSHVAVQAAGCSVTGSPGPATAIKAAAVLGTGMNADVNAGVAVEAA